MSEEDATEGLDLALAYDSLTAKKGPSEKVMFNVGYGRASVPAKDLINTSNIPLVNEQLVMVDGTERSCGHYSHSSLDAYARCAKQFWFRYVKKERPRLMARLKMLGGTAVHDANEVLLQKKMDGHIVSEQDYCDMIEGRLDESIQAFDKRYKEAVRDGDNPMALDYGERITPAQFPKLYSRVGQVFYRTEFEKVKPLGVEELFLYDHQVPSGGSIKIAGFTDLREEVNGSEVITDHKVGAKRTQAEADSSQQLSLYSKALGVVRTAVNNFVLGTTGGKSEKSPKPGEFVKFMSIKTVKDYERTEENINAIMAGIKAGAFPRTGLHNPIVCAPSQCPFHEKCLGRG